MRNVVLFGECGVGKSSIINTIVGRPVAKTSNDVFGCTDKNASYGVTLNTGIEVILWDTIGLDEGTAGKVPANRAKQHLKSFLQEQIATPEGVDLLLFCIRGASGTKSLPVKQGHWEKYNFVFEQICKKRIPVAMIVTHLESYDPVGNMDTWWNHNEGKILEFGFQLCAHACVAVLPPGPGNTDDDINRIEVSRRRLQDLLSLDFLFPRNVLLLGDPEDRADFIDMTIETRNKVENVSSSTCIPVAFDVHTHINLWNMSGFDEIGDDALVTEKNLKLLVRGIRQISGIDLLLFCFRAGRPRIRHIRNYNLFYAAICRKKVPVAIVILGPKEADAWWQRNQQDLHLKGFRFDGHVCIPTDPCQLPSGEGLDEVARHQLVHLLQEEYVLGGWEIGEHAFWVNAPNVRAVIGELSWPTTTVVVCDATGQDVFVEIAPGVRSSLRSTIRPFMEYLFQQVDPQLFPSTMNPPSSDIQPRTFNQSNKVISLLMFFVHAKESGIETWKALERFYSIYKGRITPLILVVYGASGKGPAEDFWKASPRFIKKRIGAYLTYHPGLDAHPEAQAAAQDAMVNMIKDRCLVDLGERVGVLQEILSIWKRYRSQRNKMSNGAAR